MTHRACQQKVVSLMWMTFVVVFVDHMCVYNTGHTQNTDTIEDTGNVMEKHSLKVQTFAEKSRLDYIPKGLGIYHKYVTENHKPPEKILQYLNNLTSPAVFVHAMQETILFMLSIILKGIKKVILLDLAQIENKGDPAISLGELEVLSQLDIEVIYYGCYYTPEAALLHARQLALGTPTHQVAVLSSGGGNLGIYESNDNKRIEMLKIFHKYKFVLLSQSAWFGGSHPSARDLSNLHKVRASFANHPDATILLRDQWSYDYCKVHLPGVSVYLVPDMAFGIGRPFQHFVPQPLYDIVWLERTDQEAAVDRVPLIPPNVSCVRQDWSVGWQSPVGVDLADWSYMMLHNAALFLLRGQVVITDRLHGLVLATFADIPVIIIDNNIHKISHFVNTWCQGLSSYVWAHDKKEALDKALSLLERVG